MRDSNDELVGTLFAGRYRIRSVLGRGGMGAVYLVQQEKMRRTMALKVIRNDYLHDPTIAARFQREAQAASKIGHPCVVQIFDSGESDDGRLYLAMEFVEGITLEHALRRDGPFPVPRALSVLLQISEALQAAHGAGVIHRDLKPANIVLQRSERGGERVKVLDFGLAKLVDAGTVGLTAASGRVFGTPEYIAPERCLDHPADHRADLYSLGVTAFELLTGAVPFKGNVLEVVSAHISKRPPLPSRASGRNDIPPSLDALVLRCLAKDPSQRIASAGDLLAGLRQVEREAGASTAPAPPKRTTRPPVPPASGPTLPPGAAPEEVHDTIATPVRPSTRHLLRSLLELTARLREANLGGAALTQQACTLIEAGDDLLQIESSLLQIEARIEDLQHAQVARRHSLETALRLLDAELARGGSPHLALRRAELARRQQQLDEEQRGALPELLRRRDELLAISQAARDALAEQLESISRLIRGLRAQAPAELEPFFAAAAL